MCKKRSAITASLSPLPGVYRKAGAARAARNPNPPASFSPMKVYAFFNADAPAARHDADFLRLWERSWRRMGWEPKILTMANARESKFFNEHVGDGKALAYHSTGGGAWYSSDRLINFKLKPFRPPRLFHFVPGAFWVAPKRMDDWWKMKLAGQNSLKSTGPMVGWDTLMWFEGSVDTQDVVNCGQPIY